MDNEAHMGESKIIDSKNHHWWPVCISKRWIDDKGRVGCLKPDGTIFFGKPKSKSSSIGSINFGHRVKYNTNEQSPWDYNFEEKFGESDNILPQTILNLEHRFTEHTKQIQNNKSRFTAHDLSVGEHKNILKCLLSLAIRSPRTRESLVSYAELVRGPIPTDERNRLIARGVHSLLNYSSTLDKPQGEICIIFTVDSEFIFGDGFYHNIVSRKYPLSDLKMLLPLTPNMAVFYNMPRGLRYKTPRLLAVIANKNETTMLNNVIQIYSKSMLFFRSHTPKMIQQYKMSEHQEFLQSPDPIERMAQNVFHGNLENSANGQIIEFAAEQ